jgi:hypothetical protein
MTAGMISIVLWTFVLAFVVCVGTGLSVILGWYEPKDPAVKTWLTRGLVFSIVGVVVSAGGYVIKIGQLPLAAEAAPNASDKDASATPKTTIDPSGTPAPLPSQPPISRSVVPSIANETGGDQESAKSVEHPENIKAWADNALGQRPVLNVRPSPAYPGCVADLRSRSSDDVGTTEAGACVRQLNRYHQTVIVTFYNAKAPYDTALERQESQLRKGGITDDEQPQYNYVLSEMERLNGADSPELKALTDLEETVRADRQSCANNACR